MKIYWRGWINRLLRKSQLTIGYKLSTELYKFYGTFIFMFAMKMKSKAIFMLFIFMLNTLVGFGCALHMSGKLHEKTAENHHGRHENKPEVAAHHHQPPANGTSVSDKEMCCQGSVNNFISQAKVVPQSGTIILQAPFVYIDTNRQFSFESLSGVGIAKLFTVDKRQRPPTNDIRIAIHSLLI
jgi:hypothetical protein